MMAPRKNTTIPMSMSIAYIVANKK